MTAVAVRNLLPILLKNIMCCFVYFPEFLYIILLYIKAFLYFFGTQCIHFFYYISYSLPLYTDREKKVVFYIFSNTAYTRKKTPQKMLFYSSTHFFHSACCCCRLQYTALLLLYIFQRTPHHPKN